MSNPADFKTTSESSWMPEKVEDPSCSEKMILGGLAVAGVIVLIGSAIAAWQLYGHFQTNLVFTILAVDLAGAGCIFAAVFFWPKNGEANIVGRFPTIEDVERVEVPCEGCTVFVLPESVEGYTNLHAGAFALVLGVVDKLSLSKDNPPIVDFDGYDLRSYKKIVYNHELGVLQLVGKYCPLIFTIEKEATTGPQGQQFIQPTYAPQGMQPSVKINFGAQALPEVICEGVSICKIGDTLSDYDNQQGWAIVMGSQFKGECAFGPNNPPILYFKKDAGKRYLSPSDTTVKPSQVRWNENENSLRISWCSGIRGHKVSDFSYHPDFKNVETGPEGQKFVYAGYDSDQFARFNPEFGQTIDPRKSNSCADIRMIASGRLEHCDNGDGCAIFLGHQKEDSLAFNSNNPPVVVFRHEDGKLSLNPFREPWAVRIAKYFEDDSKLECYIYGIGTRNYQLRPLSITQNGQKFVEAVPLK